MKRLSDRATQRIEALKGVIKFLMNRSKLGLFIQRANSLSLKIKELEAKCQENDSLLKKHGVYKKFVTRKKEDFFNPSLYAAALVDSEAAEVDSGLSASS